MRPNYHWHQSRNRKCLADRLASQIKAEIDRSIVRHNSVVMALSGGSTPEPLFRALLNHDIDWSKVVVTLVDERWVSESHALSNAAFVRQHLLSKLSTKPEFVRLYRQVDSADDAIVDVLSNYCASTDSNVGAPRPFDIVVLGMGADGHTASFFPDADNISELVNPDASEYLYSSVSLASKVQRISWSLAMLLNADFLALHITGENKKVVFAQACENSDACELPIRSAIFQDKTQLQVYYAD